MDSSLYSFPKDVDLRCGQKKQKNLHHRQRLTDAIKVKTWKMKNNLDLIEEFLPHLQSVGFSSVAQMCPTIWDPMNCSTPGIPVHHQLPESTQIHVHWVSDAIQHLILCHPLLLPSIFPRVRVFSNESTLLMRWPNYWSFSLNISLSNEPPGWSPLGWTGWISLQSKELSRVFSSITVQKHQFFSAQFSL